MLPGSFTIARVAGIPIRVHWTFLILLVWIVASGVRKGGTAESGLESAVFMLAVFFCVVLHELGHALTARRFGIGTRDITLLPIGGVAALERMPRKPAQELLIAIAGPLVNVVIAALLFTGVGWGEAVQAMRAVDTPGFHLDHFLAMLAGFNIYLVLFNLIPAFPMDGGRVLRALLATRIGHVRATRAAASIGRGFAMLMALAGLLLPAPMLVLIALFVWIAAAGELRDTESRSALEGLLVSAGMQRRFRVLGVDDTLQSAAGELLAGAQHDFPVTALGTAEEPVVGVLTRSDLVKALAGKGLAAHVRDAMRPSCALIDENEPLERAVEVMRTSGCALVPVGHDGRLVGLVTPENVAELVAIRSAVAS